MAAAAIQTEPPVRPNRSLESGTGGLGGAIIAALFLERFVQEDVAWAHIDLIAYNQADRPGRPEGGEAQALRAVYGMIRSRFG